MADTQQPVDQQVTSQTPATRQKNPKRVAASKAIAQRTKQAREAQRKALSEAQVIIANNQLKQADPAPDPPPSTASDEPQPSTKNVLTTTQWLCVISIIVSLAGIYYKREEIKSVFTSAPPSPVLPRAPPPSPVDAVPQAPRKVGIRKMD